MFVHLQCKASQITFENLVSRNIILRYIKYRISVIIMRIFKKTIYAKNFFSLMIQSKSIVKNQWKINKMYFFVLFKQNNCWIGHNLKERSTLKSICHLEHLVMYIHYVYIINTRHEILFTFINIFNLFLRGFKNIK